MVSYRQHPEISGFEVSKLANGPISGRIRTLEDTVFSYHYVTLGDFIITGVKGEKYACKPDIFEQTYEKVDD
jgi:hypothetical protein